MNLFELTNPLYRNEWTDAQAIRRGLQRYDGVHMNCFNEEEAEKIASFLAEDERKRTTFSWTFSRRSS